MEKGVNLDCFKEYAYQLFHLVAVKTDRDNLFSENSNSLGNSSNIELLLFSLPAKENFSDEIGYLCTTGFVKESVLSIQYLHRESGIEMNLYSIKGLLESVFE